MTRSLRLLAVVLGLAVLAGCSPATALPIIGATPTKPAPATASLDSASGPALATAPPGQCHVVDGKADRSRFCTPGAVNPNVTQDNIGSTICVSGWTKTIRPPVAYTEKLKRQQMAAYGLAGRLSDVEEDHLVALEIGGDPRSPRNLWPEQWTGAAGAHSKDAEENRLHRAVCSPKTAPGHMTLAAAQQQLIADWTHA